MPDPLEALKKLFEGDQRLREDLLKQIAIRDAEIVSLKRALNELQAAMDQVALEALRYRQERDEFEAELDRLRDV